MSTLLGEARVRIRPDTSRFETDATKGIMPNVKGLAGKVAGVFAAAAVAGYMKDAIAEARESAKIGRITTQTIKATGGAAKITADQVGDLATRLSNKTAVDDELIQSGANVILTFKNIKNSAGENNKIFDQATQAALDLSAGGFGSVQSASVMLGKALNDPVKGITALQRVGVTLTQQQKDQVKALVKTGDTLGAQKVILKEVQGQVGGLAAAAADPSARLDVIMGNLKESIGGQLIPVMDKLATFASDKVVPFLTQTGTTLKTTVLPAIQDFVTDAQGAFEKFGPKIDLSGVVQNVKDKAKEVGTQLLTGVQVGLQTGNWKPLGETLGNGIRTALGNLGSLAKTMGTALKDIIAKVKWGDLAYEFGKQAPTLLLGLATGILNFDFGSVLSFLGDHIFEVIIGVLSIAFAPAKLLGPIARLLGRIPLAGRFIEWFLMAINGVGSKITGWIGGLFKRFGEGWTAGGPGMGSAIKGAFDNAWTHIYVWADDAVIWLKSLPGRFTEWVGSWATKAGQAMRLVADSITRAIGGAVRWVLGQFGRFGGWIGGRIAAGAGLVVRGIASVSSAITGGIRSAVAWALRHVAQFGGWVGGKILAGVGQIASAMGNFIAPVTRILGTLRQKGVDGVTKLISGLKSIDLAATGRQMLDGLGHGITDFGNKVKGWATTIKDKIVGSIKELFDIHSPSRVMAGLGTHMIDGLLNGLSNGAGAVKAMVHSVFGDPITFLKTHAAESLGGLVKNVKGFGEAAIGKVAGLASSGAGWVKGLFGGGDAGGSGVQRWLPTVIQALKMTGQPVSLANTLLRRMNQESGGNPRAINLTDINAQNGDPSRGLMQTIGSTFAAYRMPGLSTDIYDPLSNIVASIRYAVSRYGNLASAYNRAGGYDSGGVANGIGFMPKATLRPERVLSPSQTKAFEEWMRGDHSAQRAPQAESPIIGGDLVIQSKDGNVRDDVTEALFQLRRIRRGGVYA